MAKRRLGIIATVLMELSRHDFKRLKARANDERDARFPSSKVRTTSGMRSFGVSVTLDAEAFV